MPIDLSDSDLALRRRVLSHEEDISRVADFWRSASGKAYRRFGRRWELPRYIREYLEPFAHFEGADPTEVEKLVGRMAHIIRSRNAKKAAVTRARRRAEKAQRALTPMLPGFETHS